MTLAVPHVVRHYYMQQCFEKGFQPLTQDWARNETLCIVGYGPSLLETWRGIAEPFMTLSGAHRFMLEKGLTPTWHADCDPREHKSQFVAYSKPETTFLMASCCHPRSWAHLRDRYVRIWHAINGPETAEWLAAHHPDWACIRSQNGSSIGIRSINTLARALGFRKVALFGFDSCYSEEGEPRAGQSDAAPEQTMSIEVGGIRYITTENMKRQAEEFTEAARGIEVDIIGDGLLKAMTQKKETA